MENFTWDAVPSQRQQKVEKYDYPVVTMAALSKPGAGRKFTFNKASQELLNIQGEDRVSFGFNNDRTIVAIRKAEGEAGLRLTKTCTTSDKRTYEFMSKLLKLNNDIENEFKVCENEGYFSLELIDPRADTRPELGMIDEDYTNNSDMKDEDCEGCQEEATEVKDAELELTASEDVTNETW
jgi:hypothetical protein